MSTKTSAETLGKLLQCDPKDNLRWLVFPAIIGWEPLTLVRTLVDFQWRPIAGREDEYTRILDPDDYPFLNHHRFIDDVEMELFGGVQGLPKACRLIDEWGLVDEIARRIDLFEQGKLPPPKLPKT